MISRASQALAFFAPTKTFRMRNRRPIVSFTFDDIDETAFSNGATVLESNGIYGTFYVAGGLCGTRYERWQLATADCIGVLHEWGHEIACHSYSHPDIQTLRRHKIDEELRANRSFFTKLNSNIRLDNFAYPYGSVGLSQKMFVQDRFLSCRGGRPGINAGRIDLGQLLAMQLYDTALDSEAVEKLIQDVTRRNGWLIFYTHDVAEAPSEHGCSPALLDHAAMVASASGCACLTVRDALVEIGCVPETAAPAGSQDIREPAATRG
jgi:peptidoglycan/xylan/chitin deacetylase (PgdA/CDA1 family)